MIQHSVDVVWTDLPLDAVLDHRCPADAPADGHAERVAALSMIEPRADRPRAITLGADKAYDAEDFVNELRSMKVRAHVAQNTSGRRSAIDGRTTRHAGYAISQRIRKRIEEPFGWIKTVAGSARPSSAGATGSDGPSPSHGRLQPRPIAEAHRGKGLMAKLPAFAKAFVGRWRIVEMDVWDKDFLDLVETAHLTFKGAADGEIAFGALKGFLDVRHGTRDGSACAEFSWDGNDENDPASGRGWVVLGTQAASSDTSTSTTATIQASYAIVPDFFNGLLRRRRPWRTRPAPRPRHRSPSPSGARSSGEAPAGASRRAREAPRGEPRAVKLGSALKPPLSRGP